MSAVHELAEEGIQRHRTALTRYSMSAPMQALGRHDYLDGRWTLFDYGCGKGGDLNILAKNGVTACGWDPHFRPDAERKHADIVNLGFVLNVIEDPEERALALQGAYGLADRVLSVAVMLETVNDGNGAIYQDGVVTSRGTFQKYFAQDELREYIVSVLDEDPVAVGPGIYFVFKDKVEEQRFFEHRQRNRRGLDRLIQRIPKPTREEREKAFYAAHQVLLDEIWDVWLTLGRAPRDEEIATIREVREAFGSLNRALRFLERFNGNEAIQLAHASRHEDLCVFLALLEFEHRTTYRSFPEELQRDIRAFFGSMKNAKDEGRALLFSAGNTELIESACRVAMNDGLGWLDDELALTLHTSLVPLLPSILRVYVGCASKLYGDVSSADLLKVHTKSGKLTLMRYEDFERSPLPKMVQRVKVDLRTQRIDVFEYGVDYAAPFLYWKSRFIADDFPKYKTQKMFDEQLARTNLFDLERYGPSAEVLTEKLRAARLAIKGFSLRPVGGVPTSDSPCGQYLTFADLISGGNGEAVEPPRDEQVYDALGHLVRQVLDPVIDYFGGIELRASAWSTRSSPKPVVNALISTHPDPVEDTLFRGCVNLKCSAAVTFHVADENMLEVAQWIAENTDFHRLVFRGYDAALSVSTALRPAGKVMIVAEPSSNPRWINREQLLAAN